MATETYNGPQGGDWFDPANWDTGGVPQPGDTADVFGPAGSISAPAGSPSGIDATAGTISGLTIDLSGQSAGSLFYNGNNTYYGFFPSLTATTIGTAGAPVVIDVTADSGSASTAGLLLDTLNGSLDIEAGQSLAISPLVGGNVTLNGNVTVGAGATLSFDQYSYFGYSDAPPVTLDGRVLVNGGTLAVTSSDVSGTGVIEIANKGTVDFNPVLKTVVSSAIAFDSTGGTLVADQLAVQVTGTITGFGAGDTILAYDESIGTYPVSTDYTGGVLTLSELGQVVEQFSIAGNYTTANFHVSQTGGVLDITYAPCFATGTLIATDSGPVRVDQLVVGDRVSLATGGYAPLVWLGHRRQIAGHVIRIRADALGPDRPTRDLIVSADHGIFLDGILVPAGLLADGAGIVVETRDEVVFWHVELDRHAILLAENTPAETYLDTGNRRQFGNCPLAYDPVDATRDPCAEMVFAGERLDAIRRLLPVAMA